MRARVPLIQKRHLHPKMPHGRKDATNTPCLLSLFPRREERQTHDDMANIPLLYESCHLTEKDRGRHMMKSRKTKKNPWWIHCKSHPRLPRTNIQCQDTHELYCTETPAQRRESRDFFRAALRGWMMCFLAAISMDFIVRGRIFLASSTLPAATASRVFRTIVFINVRQGARRRCRTRFCRAAFIAECVRGMGGV